MAVLRQREWEPYFSVKGLCGVVIGENWRRVKVWVPAMAASVRVDKIRPTVAIPIASSDPEKYVIATVTPLMADHSAR